MMLLQKLLEGISPEECNALVEPTNKILPNRSNMQGGPSREKEEERGDYHQHFILHAHSRVVIDPNAGPSRYQDYRIQSNTVSRVQHGALLDLTNRTTFIEPNMQGEPPMNMQGGPPMITQGGPPIITQGGPSMVTQGGLPMITQGGPPMNTQGRPPVITQGGPLVNTWGEDPGLFRSNQSGRRVTSLQEAPTEPSIFPAVVPRSHPTESDHRAAMSPMPSGSNADSCSGDNSSQLCPAMSPSAPEATMPACAVGEDPSVMELSNAAQSAEQSQLVNIEYLATLVRREKWRIGARVYRQKLNLRYDLLKETVPTLAMVQRAPKCLILDSAISYIQHLQKELRRLEKKQAGELEWQLANQSNRQNIYMSLTH
ncbi:uncharacterized protein [Hyperolius riggenbachi]|uniref:uncharacterized protein n=1 Tax=Hyperolius riggenbachi TaxID=752182 RepID=UPI0035A2F8E5